MGKKLVIWVLSTGLLAFVTFGTEVIVLDQWPAWAHFAVAAACGLGLLAVHRGWPDPDKKEIDRTWLDFLQVQPAIRDSEAFPAGLTGVEAERRVLHLLTVFERECPDGVWKAGKLEGWELYDEEKLAKWLARQPREGWKGVGNGREFS